MKLRKIIAISSIISLCVMSVTGCGKNTNTAGGRTANQGNNVSDVLEAGLSDETTEETTEEKTTETTTEVTTTEAVTTEEVTETVAETEEELETIVEPPKYDVDLTQLSSTMVYSEVYNMMVTPGDYMGKVIKMSGPFSVYTDETTGKNYFACVIQDATACCAQGIEFELGGDYVYPDNYPAVGSEITVSGTFDTYEEDGYTYCTLRDAVLE